MQGYAIKDLYQLGRDISKTIIIDNIYENFGNTSPDNGLQIVSWYDDLEDQELKEYIPFLKQIVINKEPDVRTVIREYGERMNCYVDKKKK
mmetsp:Transcript_32509/g.31756  ORF Transcript_32509/g.31756 Transcript_32509/m.31756 type:complete len:91 (+) Transcript_32509:1953-2225(+)